MAMQTDVKASKPLAATGQVKDQLDNNLGRCRIKGLYWDNGASAGSVVFRDGGASGAIVLTLNTDTLASSGTPYILLPGEGILVETDLHGTVTNTASIVVFYG